MCLQSIDCQLVKKQGNDAQIYFFFIISIFSKSYVFITKLQVLEVRPITCTIAGLLSLINLTNFLQKIHFKPVTIESTKI